MVFPAPPSPLPARPSEALLIEHLEGLKGARILATTLGRAQLALEAARARPEARVRCWLWDAHHAGEARRALGEGAPANLELVTAADPPADEVDLVLLPLTSGGEAELAREQLQLGHERLAQGGLLAASTDNPEDDWLLGQMRRLFDAVTRRPGARGVAYIARKTAPLARPIDFTRRFAFRDRGRLIEAVSRPGVFAHGRLDPGARALLEEAEVAPSARVLDIGCGSGCLSLAAALRADGVRVTAVDASLRAVACTLEGAARNGVSDRVEARVDASGRFEPEAGYDLALANPPYFGDWRIARLFVEGARAALRPGGRLLLVCKAAAWYREHLPALFDPVEARERRGGYTVVSAVRGEA